MNPSMRAYPPPIRRSHIRKHPSHVSPPNTPQHFIHTNPFLVTKMNDKPLAVPQWRDTAIVERKGGTLTFRSRFLDYTGVYMLHCHMMNHEEMGMMQTVEVYK